MRAAKSSRLLGLSANRPASGTSFTCQPHLVRLVGPEVPIAESAGDDGAEPVVLWWLPAPWLRALAVQPHETFHSMQAAAELFGQDVVPDPGRAPCVRRLALEAAGDPL